MTNFVNLIIKLHSFHSDFIIYFYDGESSSTGEHVLLIWVRVVNAMIVVFIIRIIYIKFRASLRVPTQYSPIRCHCLEAQRWAFIMTVIMALVLPTKSSHCVSSAHLYYTFRHISVSTAILFFHSHTSLIHWYF